MLLAKALARKLSHSPKNIANGINFLYLDSIANPGFPGELSDSNADQPGVTKCICLGSGHERSNYAADLLAAFEDYERFADTREIPPGGALLSPVLPVGQALAPFRIAACPEERYLFTRGNLPLPCPECGMIVHAVGRGPFSSMAEYFEYECCHPFYYFHPFREWAFDKAVYDPATSTLYHHGHRYGRREFLFRMFEDFRRSLTACVQDALKGGRLKSPELNNGMIPVLIGRGEFNPGHIIFEDLAGAFLLCEAMDACGIKGNLELLLCEKARWYEPLLGILPGHRVAQVTPVPSDMAAITSLLCRKGLALVNPKVHPCWPHTCRCEYLKRMCKLITALADRKVPEIGNDTMRVVFPIRTHNRSWEPLFENVERIIRHLVRRYSPVHFVLHAVGTRDHAYDPFRDLAARRRDVELLFDAPLLNVLAQYGSADLCVGPIGSGFWWAGLFGVPSVTIHPENRPDTVEQGAWILPPPKGSCPHFLALNPNQRFVVLEEKNPHRETYGSLRLPVDKVFQAIEEILRPSP